MDTDKNLEGKAVPSEVESATDWWPVFAALKFLRICVHLCSSVVKARFNCIVPAQEKGFYV